MYQVNYAGLKKRDLYDEIVALVEGDRTKMKYPNRVATQIMNSPYMKQLDAKSLLDIENQQDKLNKDKMKEVIIKSMAEGLGDHHSMVKALIDKSRLEPAHEALKKGLGDVSMMDKSFESARSDVGDELDLQSKMKELRKHMMSRFVSEHLEGQSNPMMSRASAGVNVTAISQKDIADRDSMIYEREQENLELKAQREKELLEMRERENQMKAELARLKALEHIEVHNKELKENIRRLTSELENHGTVWGRITSSMSKAEIIKELKRSTGDYESPNLSPISVKSSSKKSRRSRAETPAETPADSVIAPTVVVTPDGTNKSKRSRKSKSATPAALSEAPTVVVTPSQPVNRALEFNIGTGPNTPQTPQTRPEPKSAPKTARERRGTKAYTPATPLSEGQYRKIGPHKWAFVAD